jgi:hypothetical protein
MLISKYRLLLCVDRGGFRLCEALGKRGLARPLSYCNSCCIDKHMFAQGPRQKPMLPMPKTASVCRYGLIYCSMACFSV